MSVGSAPSLDDALGLDRPAAAPRRRRRGLDAAIALTGELLITAGVLLGLYVVWQLFYTDIQSARTQNAALEATDFPESVDAPAVVASGDTVVAADPEAPLELIPDELKVYSPLGAPILKEPGNAVTFGALWVPRWGADYVKPISEGTDRHLTLDRLGIGHYADTAMPGEVGNFSIAGHRTTYGKPFANIDKLQVGDAIVVQTDDAWFVYRVTSSQIVLPTQVDVIAPVPGDEGATPTEASITLTSCHPKFSAEKRYVVHGELEYWAPAGHGYPQEVFQQP